MAAVESVLADLHATINERLSELAQVGEDRKHAARDAVAEALHALLLHLATSDCAEQERRTLDSALSEQALSLKGGLLKALKQCALHRAFLGLPLLMEQTRQLLAGAPAKGVASYLEDALCTDIDACEDPRALVSVQEVHQFFTGVGRLKKELHGVELPAAAKKSCRTCVNRAARAFAALEQKLRKQAAQTGPASKPKVYEMEKDFRVEEQKELEAQYNAREMGLDAMFDKAMQLKNDRAKDAMSRK
uniref:Uncharacterized protein n=1 Tax=Calcidiscus leptoporus TaxID=127549 RepID=A0A7S0NXA3_9EUKA|mmetsp:Transcript_37608/g.87945  ORF Transcript_37608/g.87945 Transcript_37608/m.87945 type:complete len:247 (+) Transcript_37608:129-869(+)